jgi:phosphoribosylglycinamide formyltransferase-1
MRVVVLISGRGSNLTALLNDQQNYRIAHVISNNFKAKGLASARQHGVPNTCIKWDDSKAAENILIELIQDSQADLIVLAGFMRILSDTVVQAFHNKIINIHPSLLPKYPGLNTHQKVLDNNDSEHGATVHLVDQHLDHGRILAQTQFSIGSESDAKILADQLIIKEHKLLTTVVGLIASNNLTWDSVHTYIGDKIMTQPLLIN